MVDNEGEGQRISLAVRICSSHVARMSRGDALDLLDIVALGARRDSMLEFTAVLKAEQQRQQIARTYLKIADCCRSDNNVE
jgi:hypothetical protein